MKLEDLVKSLSRMTPEEKLAKIAEIREDRQVSRTAITRRVQKAKDKGERLLDRFNKLSPEEQEELRELLTASKEK